MSEPPPSNRRSADPRLLLALAILALVAGIAAVTVVVGLAQNVL